MGFGEASPGQGLTGGERRAVLSLASLFMLRMLGLFLILPVLAVHAEQLAGATPALVGLAIGAYGLTQALLQIPYGWLSDRIGRKRMILVGLALFAAGSVVAALGEHIVTVVLGRALQGAGAIAAVVLALAADLTRADQRTKAMAVIGMSIGMSFALAMVLGPMLGHWIGVHGIFWVCAGLAVAGMGITLWWVPAAPVASALPTPGAFVRVLRDSTLIRLYLGVGVLHMILTASFIAIPVALRDDSGFVLGAHWRFYLPALVLSVAAVMPFVFMGDRRGWLRPMVLAAIGLLALGQFGLASSAREWLAMALLLWLFFVAFNLLEAVLPSLVSRYCPSATRGAAMGLFATGQFLGAFLGGALGGLVAGRYGLEGVFLFNAALASLWLAATLTMPAIPAPRSVRLELGALSEAEASSAALRLRTVPGVTEAVVDAARGVAYLKLDRRAGEIDEEGLRRLALARA